MPPPSAPLSPISLYSPTGKFSNIHPFVFMEASLHRYGWLNHWPLVIDSTSSPSPLLGSQVGGWRGGIKSFNLLWGWFSWQPAPFFWCFSKDTSLTLQKTSLSLSSQEIPRVLRALCQKWVWKPNIYIHRFLIINHNITVDYSATRRGIWELEPEETKPSKL